MSQRTEKVSSLIQQVVAAELAQLPDAARLTVTKVDVTPDLREATIWVGVIAAYADQVDDLLAVAVNHRRRPQEAVASRLQTKFVPRLTIQRDLGGEYADQITKLIRGL